MTRKRGAGWEDVLDAALRKFPLGSKVTWRWKRKNGWIEYEGVVVSYEWMGGAAHDCDGVIIKGMPWLCATVRTDTHREYHVPPKQMRRRP